MLLRRCTLRTDLPFDRCVGVVGGVFVCMGYAIRVTTKAVEVVSGADDPGLVAAEASGAKIGKGLRAKWGGGEIRSRSKIVRQGSGWTMEGSPGTPSYSTFAGTPPISASNSPYLASPGFGSNPGTPNFSTPSFGPSSPRPYTVPPPPSRGMRTPSLGTESGVTGSPLINPTSFSPPLPGAPTYSMFPPTPNPEAGGFPTSAPPRKVSSGPKKDD